MTRKSGSLLWAALFCCIASCATRLHAQTERILAFHSDVRVQDDSTMQVVEIIRVVSAGQQIRHGIYRDFPTTYTDKLGNRYVVGFHVLAATRDGYQETFRVEDRANGKRIYLGQSKYFVQPGEHTYTLSYATNRQIGFFDDHDELFWNVTGNGWSFPIEQASASVRLPENIPPDKIQPGGNTGPQGSRAQDLTFAKQDDNSFDFFAARPLRAGEGLTILLTWPKGYLAPPTQQEKFQYFLQDNRDAVLAVAGLAVILIYYLIVWGLFGREPAAGPVVTQYEPPQGLSPAGIRYLVRMGYDNKTFASAVLDMAVKGYLQIKEQAGSYTLYRTKNGPQGLASEEQAAADKLFNGESLCWLNNVNHSRISDAMTALKNWLKTAEYKIYFVTNARYMIPAVILSIVMLLAMVLLQSPMKLVLAAFMTFWLSVWNLAVAGMIVVSAQLWKGVLTGGAPNKGTAVTQAIFMTLVSIPFIGFDVMGLAMLAGATSIGLAVALIASALLHAVFHHLLKARTPAGRGLLDKIEGFKRFLAAVDGDRMRREMSAQKTPEMFEKFLPYALALDVEQAWASQFSSVLNAASASGQNSSSYSPTWYSGSAWSNMGAGAFVGSLSSSFSDAISSSSNAPGSSSGSDGGGGGSGGGGGGGGGGGW